MAQDVVVGPLPYDFGANFPSGGGGGFDPLHFPEDDLSDVPPFPGFAADLDIDADLEFDGDLDFSIADLLDIPDAEDDPPAACSDCKDGSGVSSSSSASVPAPGGGCPDPDGELDVPSPESGDSTTGEELVKLEDDEEEETKGWSLKRKKGREDGLVTETSANPGARSSKFRRSGPSEKGVSSCVFNPGSGEEEKRKARLMRNRESAQLSRQRKKHYVEELEEKVRSMHSTITELNSKISFIMTENASLRQQLSGGAGSGNCPPPAVYPHPPLMTSMHFPWIPCSSYAMRPPGPQVPLIPIPRLKTQQLASAPKPKKSESRKAEGKTKKVAGVSLLGLLLFMLFAGVFVPGSKLGLDGNGDIVLSEQSFSTGKLTAHSQGRVLTVRGNLDRSNLTEEVGMRSGKRRGVRAGDYVTRLPRAEAQQEEYGSHNVPNFAGNATKPLFASLYVPRNDKLVKIDGNLIIHSVLASEKAKAHLASGAKSESATQHYEKENKETSLAIAGNLASALVSKSARDMERRAHLYRSIAAHQRALAYGSKDKYRDNSKSTPMDGPVKEWFREGLEGPILSSGVCTEVFQFDAASANSGGIVPATPITNVTDKHNTDSSHPGRVKNRRALHPQAIPLPGATINKTEGGSFGKPPEASNFRSNKSASSVVVSVLVDPREAGDSEGEGVISPKSVSRIFVVVLLDSVKYVTYSCVLPFKSSTPHL